MNRDLKREVAIEVVSSIMDKGLTVKEAMNILCEATMFVKDIPLLAYREQTQLPLSDFRDQFDPS